MNYGFNAFDELYYDELNTMADEDDVMNYTFMNCLFYFEMIKSRIVLLKIVENVHLLLEMKYDDFD